MFYRILDYRRHWLTVNTFHFIANLHTVNMNVSDSNVLARVSNKNYMFYEDRLSSFLTWPQQIWPSKEDLAFAGLYYTGQSDLCRCFMCNVELCQWNCTDSAINEHRKWMPDCAYLRMIGQSAKSQGLLAESSFTNAIGSRQSSQGFSFDQWGHMWTTGLNVLKLIKKKHGR